MSETAKNGFRTENQVVSEFNNWNRSKIAKRWLSIIGYSKIKTVNAKTTSLIGLRPKADVTVKINNDKPIEISVKKFKISFNQID